MAKFFETIAANSVASAILVISLAVIIGLAIGNIKFGSIRFGVAGVLFGAIFLGHLGFSIDHEVLEFCRELGLMLFVFLTGLQVGPGFISAFKRHGVVLNSMAAAVVLLGVLLTIVIGKTLLKNDSFAISVGLLSGATTNTPSLGAAQQALIERGFEQHASLTSIGYAVAYPFGVIGIILVMLLLKFILKIDLSKEQKLFDELWGSDKAGLISCTFKVENKNIAGHLLSEIVNCTTPRVTISRILHNNELKIASPDIRVKLGDSLLVVGSQEGITNFQMLVGSKTEADLTDHPGSFDTRRALVTNNSVIGKTISELNYISKYNVSITRVLRSGVEFVAYPETRIQFADTLRLVGEENRMKLVATELGDSRTVIDSPRLISMFIGLAAGIILGLIPFSLPGIPVPVKLGLAGGPLIAAIIFSSLGKIGPVIWHMPETANRTLREFGIILFLACVGLKAGAGFFETLINGSGLYYMLYGALITVVPIAIVGFIASIFFKQNFISLCGLLAGSMTDPPALAFADNMTGSKGSATAYATVYPVVMILRIIAAQILVLVFF